MTRIYSVSLCCESHKALVIEIHFKRIETSDCHIEPHIILVASNKVRMEQISLYHEVRKTIDMTIASNQSDSTSTAQLRRLQDPERRCFSGHLKASVIFREYVGLGHETILLLSKVITVNLKISTESIFMS